MKENDSHVAQNRRSPLRVLLSVALLAAAICAAIFIRTGKNKPKPDPSMTVEEQLALLVEHRDQWIVDPSTGFSWQAYAVTDLDQDGQIELLAAWYNQDGPHDRFYQVDPVGSTLRAPYELEGDRAVFSVEPARKTQRASLATGGTARVAEETCPVYLKGDDGEATRYWYVFETGVPGRSDGDVSLSSIKQALSLGEGGPEVRLLGSVRQLPSGRAYYDAEGREIDEAGYRALAEVAFSGQADATAQLLWLDRFSPGDYDGDRLFSQLQCSYEGFGLENGGAAPLATVSPAPTAGSTDEGAAALGLYRQVLGELIENGYYGTPDRSVVFNLRHLLWDSEARKFVTGWGDHAENRFALLDVDGDDRQELLLWLKGNASGLRSDCVYVLSYGSSQKPLLLEGQFTSRVVFYDGGYAVSPLYGDGEDDRQFHRYDPQRDCYIPLDAAPASFDPGGETTLPWRQLTAEEVEASFS